MSLSDVGSGLFVLLCFSTLVRYWAFVGSRARALFHNNDGHSNDHSLPDDYHVLYSRDADPRCKPYELYDTASAGQQTSAR